MLGILLSILLSIYHPPVSYDMSLAGNFGEPRPHHFHGGLDIKTDGVEGKAVYAIGDGYVSRVTMGKYGFGNAVYVTHPEGYTSVYCHLQAFTPRIRRAMRRYQYAHETSDGDAYFSPLDCPVAQGQLIALSGNTGHSTGPHLHLEIHDTETWNMLDPCDFIGDFINDTVPPKAHGLMACPQVGEGIFNGGAAPQTFSITGPTVERDFTAWGKVGFALWADDYMQESNNHFGIRETILNVDGQEVFHAVVNDIPVESNRLVNAWGDYDHWLHHRTWYMKSFIEPGNTLQILRAEHRGIVDFSEERDYQLEYILRDYKGNESRYAFKVRGEAGEVRRATHADDRSHARLFRWNQTNTFSVPGMQLVVPYGLLAADMYLQPTKRSREEAFSDSYSFYPSSYPLISEGEISLYAYTDRVGSDEVVRPEFDTSKFYVAANGQYAGGDYQNGWVTGRILELGASYTLEYDDEAPQIQPVRTDGHTVEISLTDRQSGVAAYTATLDGQFVVFDEVEKTSHVICRLDESPIRQAGRSRHLVFTATDHRDNSRTYETDIIF